LSCSCPSQRPAPESFVPAVSLASELASLLPAMAFLDLPRKFSKARLDLEILREPLARGRLSGQRDIVQIDIATRHTTAQRFRMFPGSAENRIDVLGSEAARRQLVLFIDEPRRRFEVALDKRRNPNPSARIVGETATSFITEQFTAGRKRHFLCGMDEQHLFIAELPRGASSTHEARESLRNPAVPSSLTLRGQKIVRQGEWFFAPLAAAEQARVVTIAKARGSLRCIGIAQAAKIPRAGRPHVADEVVVDHSASGEACVYVRGAIRHPDHQTVTFRDFCRAYPNRERFERPEGVYWVD
jgi:hypothetical protein